MEVVEVPVEVYVEHGGLEGDVHEYFACEVETEGVHESTVEGVECTVVTLTVVEEYGTDGTVQLVDILVVTQGCCLVGAGKCWPLAAIGEREVGRDLGTGHCGVEIQWISIELGESNVLGFYALQADDYERCDCYYPTYAFFHNRYVSSTISIYIMCLILKSNITIFF